MLQMDNGQQHRSLYELTLKVNWKREKLRMCELSKEFQPVRLISSVFRGRILGNTTVFMLIPVVKNWH